MKELATIMWLGGTLGGELWCLRVVFEEGEWKKNRSVRRLNGFVKFEGANIRC